jgi:hypothetical protein
MLAPVKRGCLPVSLSRSGFIDALIGDALIGRSPLATGPRASSASPP